MKYFMTPQRHGLGWVPDVPDQRDYTYTPKLKALQKLPKVVDLRDKFPPVYNQGPLGSCTAQALAAAFDFNRHKQGVPFMDPSRLFIYWNERDIEGTVDSDAGAQLRTGVKVLVRYGTPQETLWPYDIKKFTLKPPAHTYVAAEKSQALTYARIMRPDDSCDDMIACLNEGFPFVTGFMVYESFEAADTNTTGIVPMPGTSENALGGHALVVVGYDLAKQHFICRNSWGQDWGDEGYCYMPFEYLARADLSSDQWTIRLVEV
jgi:C1A family cysteine protease